jgi:hypothetical protein
MTCYLFLHSESLSWRVFLHFLIFWYLLYEKITLLILSIFMVLGLPVVHYSHWNHCVHWNTPMRKAMPIPIITTTSVQCAGRNLSAIRVLMIRSEYEYSVFSIKRPGGFSLEPNPPPRSDDPQKHISLEVLRALSLSLASGLSSSHNVWDVRE